MSWEHNQAGDPYRMHWRHLTEWELTALVYSYSDERLLANHARASEQPGTDWERRLSAEIRRRGLTGWRTEQEEENGS